MRRISEVPAQTWNSTTCFFQVIFLTHFIMALTQQWIIPDLVNSLVPFSETDLPLATERLIRQPLFKCLLKGFDMLSISRLAIPNHIIWLLGGYLVFHSCLNISGELLYFADRDFYHDWWNSTNFSKFWQNWNLPVHRWFLRHIYKPLLAAGFPQKHIMQVSYRIRLVSWRSDHDRVSRLLLLPRVHRFCSTEDAQALAVHWLHVQRSPGTKAH